MNADWSNAWVAFTCGGIMGWALGVLTMGLKEMVAKYQHRKRMEAESFSADDVEGMLAWSGEGAVWLGRGGWSKIEEEAKR